MRLWHEALLPYLPRQQLLGQHRECCALRGRGWGKPHATVNYVFDHPYGWLFAYHKMVMAEMERRGYEPNEDWYGSEYRGRNLPVYSTKQSQEIWEEALDRSMWSDPFLGSYIYPEHNAAYLQECLDNLARKGIHIDMEAKNASDL